MNFYSQQNEDKEIYELFFKNKKIENGFFLELGAYNGITASNTKFFEDELNFKGILIEAIPNIYKELVNNRPNCILYNKAITDKKDKVKYIGQSMTAGIEENMTEWHKNHWGLKNVNEYLVDTDRIDNITKINNVNYIDLFSIDVEGSELEVLNTIDWSVPIYLILIELVPEKVEIETEQFLQRIKKSNKCRNILRENGFDFVKRIGGNDLWINKNYKR